MTRIRIALYVLLFGLLVAVNNCGGGGGGGGVGTDAGNSFLDQMSSNTIQVTSLESVSNTILGNVALILSEEGNELTRLVAQTNESGAYTFGGVKIGIYTVRAVKPGYNEATSRVIVTDGPQKIQVRLTASFPPTSVSGTCTNIATNAPVPDVIVEVQDSSPLISSRSGSDGIFTLREVPPGTYTVKASKTGYASQERSNVIKSPNIAVTGVNFQLSASATSEVKLPGKIRGIVKDQADGQPLQGVTVQIKGATLGSNTTDAQGYFNFDNVEADVIYILTAYTTTPARKGTGDRVVARYYQTYTQSSISIGSGQIQIYDITMTAAPEDPNPVKAEFAGTVIDGVSNVPLEGVSIEVIGTPFRTTTNANGAFYTTGISTGIDYIFLFTKAGYSSKTHTQTLVPGYNLLSYEGKTQIPLVPVVSQKNKATIVGTVRDDYAGTLLAGVGIEILGTTIRATTTSSGAYLISDIPVPTPNGTDPAQTDITLVFTKDNYRPKTLALTVDGGKTRQVDPQDLERMKGSIVITVFDSKTQSRIDGATVTFQGFTPKSGNNSANTSGGRVTFSDIPLGTYNFTITQDQYASSTLTGVVITQDNQTVNASAYLNRDIVNVEGYVYNELNGLDGFQSGPGGDQPLSQITVTVTVDIAAGAPPVTSTSLTNGYYRVSNLPVGTRYTVKTSGVGASDSNYRHEEREVNFLVGQNRLDIGLYKIIGSVSGFVFQDDNRDGVYSNEPKIGGATITATNLTDGANLLIVTATTDQDGNFLIQNVKAGNIQVTVAKSDANYQQTFKIVQMTDGASVTSVAIPMVLNDTSISGQVFDGASNRPIEGVKVSIVGHAGIIATTDALGSYRLNNVPLTPASKILLFDATAKGYGIATTNTSVVANNATIIERATLLYRTTRMIYGTVIDSRSGAGVSGIELTLTYSEGSTAIEVTHTLSSGGFTFPNVVTSDNATVTLDLRDPLTQSNGQPRYQPTSRQVVVQAGDPPLKITPEIPMVPKFTNLRGYVLESTTNQPVNVYALSFTPSEGGGASGTTSYIKVLLVETGQSAEVSLVNGEFFMKNVPSSENYTLKVYHQSDNTYSQYFNDAVKSFTSSTNAETNAGIVYISLNQTTVSGTITDAKTGLAVAGVAVKATIGSVPGYSASATTGGDGKYTLRTIPYDHYVIAASQASYESAQQNLDQVTMLAPPGTTVNFTLSPKSGTISGRLFVDTNANNVLDAGDQLLHLANGGQYAGTVYTISYLYNGQTYTVDSNPDATYTLSAVPIGSHFVEAAPKTGTVTPLGTATWNDPANPADYLVDVATSGTTPASADFLLKIQGHQTGRIYGYVYDFVTGQPISGMTVRLKRTTDAALVQTVTTDSGGYLTFNAIAYYTDASDADEIYYLEFSKNGYRSYSSDKYSDPLGTVSDIKLSDGVPLIRITARIDPNSGSIAGKVTNSQSGATVTGAVVKIKELALQTPTDALGQYEFPTVIAGSYTLLVTAPAFASKTVAGVTITDNSQEVALDVSLSPQFGGIKGKVYEEVNGLAGYQVGADKPLSAMSIQYVPVPQGAATPLVIKSDSNGAYDITNLALGTYQFIYAYIDPADPNARATYTAVIKNLTVADGVTLTQDVPLTPLYNAIQGVVYSDDNGNGLREPDEVAVENVYIANALDANPTILTTASSDGNGYYHFLQPVGSQIIKASVVNPLAGAGAPTGPSTTHYYYDFTGVTTVLTNGTVTFDIGMIPIMGKISGKIFDADTRQPLAGVKVVIEGTNLSTVTDANGEYLITNVPVLAVGETYTLIFDAVSAGYDIFETNTAANPPIVGPTSALLNFRYQTVNLTPRKRSVNGRVINNLTLDGVSGASTEVTLYNGSKLSSITDSQGYFIIADVPVKSFENYRMSVFQSEYETKIVNFYLGPGDSAYQIQPDIQLTSTRGNLTGRVIDRTTNWPVQSTTIQLQATVTGFSKTGGDVSIQDTVQVDNDGYFRLSGIPRGGPYTLTVATTTGHNTALMKDVARSVSVTGGQTTNLGVIYCYLEEFNVDGSVYDLGPAADGQFVDTASTNRLGVDNATVTLVHAASGYTVTTTTNWKGSFEVRLPPIDFKVTAVATDYSSASKMRDYATDSSPVTLELRPNSRAVTGRAYFDTNGNGFVDNAEQVNTNLIYSYSGGLLQGNELRVFYTYRGTTVAVYLMQNSSFTFNDVPVGSRAFYVEGDGFITHYWINPTNLSDTLVDVTTGSTDPASVDIAIRTHNSAYGNLDGVVRDYKIWVESAAFHPDPAPTPQFTEDQARWRAQWQVAGIRVYAKSGDYIQSTVTDGSGIFHLFLPTGPSGREYQITICDPNDPSATVNPNGPADVTKVPLYESQTTGPVLIQKAGPGNGTGLLPRILTEVGGVSRWVDIHGLDFDMVPRTGTIVGTVFYDNNVDGDYDATDYDGIARPDIEYPVNAVVGHPWRSNNWTEQSFVVYYNYRGLTFGSTYYDRGTSVYTIPRVPVGRYGQPNAADPIPIDHYTSFYCRDFNQDNGDWDSIDATSVFRPTFYTTDGKKPANFTIAEGQSKILDFATFVNGGDLVIRGTHKESPNVYQVDAQGNNYDTTTPIYGSDYGFLFGFIPPAAYKFEVNFIELGFKWPYTQANPLITIQSFKPRAGYAVVNDWSTQGQTEPIIIPPGVYTVAFNGIADLSSGMPAGNDRFPNVGGVNGAITIDANRPYLWDAAY